MSDIFNPGIGNSGGDISNDVVTATGSNTPRTLANRFAESVNVLDYGASPSASSLANYTAIQAAVVYAASHTGSVYVPPGTYNVSVATPILLPSNITFWGVKGQSILVPDISTILPDKAGTLAFGAVIMTGVPATGVRAGVTTGQSVSAATCVNNVHISGITIDNSAYAASPGTHIATGTHLSGIQIWFAHGCSMVDCAAFNMPNTGLYVFGCRNFFGTGNRSVSNGFLTLEGGSLNGVSLRGWIDSVSQSLSAVNYIFTENTSNYNFQEGIQSDTVQGLILTNNTLIGNHEYAIEGEASPPGTTDTSATYGYPVPADVIIANNFIDGFDPVAGTTGISGIRWASANQGKISIKGNTVKNIDNTAGVRFLWNGATSTAFTSGVGINAVQVNNGTISIEDNLLQLVSPGSTGAVITGGADVMHVNGNTAVSCGTSNFFSTNVSNGFTSLLLNGNIVDGVVARFAFITPDAGGSATAGVINMVITNNVVSGLTRPFVTFSFPHNATVGYLNVSENTARSITSTSTSGDGFLRFTGNSPTNTLAVTEFDCMNNVVSYAGTSAYPIMFDSTIGTGAITKAQIFNNRFGATTNAVTINTATAITSEFEGGNSFIAGANYTTQAQLNNSTLAATTAYVDLAVSNAVAGVNPATSVNASTTQASDTSGLTYANGASGIGATFTGTANTAITIDGFTFTAVGQRLLVKNDTQSPSGAFNGVYTLTVLQILAVAPVFTRALDYDTPSDINNTGAIPVISGTVNTNTSWLQTSNIVTVGTTPLTYVQFSYAPSTIQKGVFANKPSSPVQGQVYFATDLGTNGVTIVYSGSIWKPMTGSAVIYQSGAATGTTNAAASTTLATATIPASLLSANGRFRITVVIVATGANGTKTINIRLSASSGSGAGTSLATQALTTTQLSGAVIRDVWNANSTGAQVCVNSGNAGAGLSTNTITTASINTANVSYINFDGQTANAGDTIGYAALCVEWLEP